jgi:hypothetical protein
VWSPWYVDIVVHSCGFGAIEKVFLRVEQRKASIYRLWCGVFPLRVTHSTPRILSILKLDVRHPVTCHEYQVVLIGQWVYSMYIFRAERMSRLGYNITSIT